MWSRKSARIDAARFKRIGVRDLDGEVGSERGIRRDDRRRGWRPIGPGHTQRHSVRLGRVDAVGHKRATGRSTYDATQHVTDVDAAEPDAFRTVGRLRDEPEN